MFRRMPGEEPDPLSKGQRWLSSIAALTVAVVVLMTTENIYWGLGTFLVLGALFNLAFFLTKAKK